MAGDVMLDSIIQRATEAQARASNPTSSVFVGASAGSGKTKLLIDRLLRLMLPRVTVRRSEEDSGEEELLLPGADPANILCLTFTKAAAAEMQNRLRAKLAEWFSLSDTELLKELKALEVPDAENVKIRQGARDLLRKVLESPVGVRIETIHAFCESILRRFPAEAKIDPNFSIIDDQEKNHILTQAIEGAFPDHRKSIEILSPQRNFEGQSTPNAKTIMGLVGDLSRAQEQLRCFEDDKTQKTNFENLKALYFQALDLSEEDENWEREWVTPPKEAALVAGFRKIITIKPEKAELLEWLLTSPDQRLPEIWGKFITTKGTLNSRFLVKAEKAAAPELETLLKEEVERLLNIQRKRQNVHLAHFGAAFLSLGLQGVKRLKERKNFTGQLDYDDLIAQTKALLDDLSMDWVRYKLDGGIDHLLLDEVQDNSSIQWKIVDVLTSDFFTSSEQVRSKNRTIFAVGDVKQSIFGFQGAKPEEFLKSRQRYANKIQAAGFSWDGGFPLITSFRTTKPVLTFVNELFKGEMGEGVREDGEDFPEHLSARKAQWGKVEVWPAIQVLNQDQEESEEEEDFISHQPTSASLLVQRLCSMLQAHFEGTQQPALKPKDVLFLVRNRSDLPPTLMRALKKENIPIVNCIGGRLMETPQAKDMMALCEALLLPSDDFSFACFLTSPLGGLDDPSLMDLRLGPKEFGAEKSKSFPPLWKNLQDRFEERADWRKAYEIFSNLLNRLDYDSPYQILSQALGTFGGRAGMFARFGQEALEPLDRFLEAALEYETLHIPSFQGFVAWMQQNESEIKRQPAEGENAVRFMTVHGAKGLQAPLVIVLCKKGKTKEADGFYWLESIEGEQKKCLPIDHWGEDLPEICEPEKTERQMALEQEENRLLYVAVTRPADALIVAGCCNAQQRFSQPKWVEACEKTLFQLKKREGFTFKETLSGLNLPKNAEEFPSFIFEANVEKPERLTKEDTSIGHSVESLPEWVGKDRNWQAIAPEKEDRLARPLRPSQSEDGALEDLPAVSSPLDEVRITPKSRKQQAAQRGKIIHHLLEFLPDIAPEERFFIALNWLDQNAKTWDDADREEIAQKMTDLLEKPSLAKLFEKGSRAEQPLTGVASGQVVNGIVDRLNLTKEGIFLADYKTGKKFFGEKSKAYQLQLALYAGLLKEIYPDLPLKAYLIWTESLEETVFSENFLKAVLEQWKTDQEKKKKNEI
ncbi:hypothetical protein FAI41_03215 [Acetobacteraceae bacterium]|nr:hypothetical protein FAI41_03215 [Acetobacteraceae bacterium]